MCYEVLYLYININFLFCGFIFQDLTSHIFILVLLTIIAAESAIVLSLIVFHYNLGGELEL
jgi:NADH:ubiquinone oxidoreductase subunit K